MEELLAVLSPGQAPVLAGVTVIDLSDWHWAPGSMTGYPASQ